MHTHRLRRLLGLRHHDHNQEKYLEMPFGCARSELLQQQCHSARCEMPSPLNRLSACSRVSPASPMPTDPVRARDRRTTSSTTSAPASPIGCPSRMVACVGADPPCGCIGTRRSISRLACAADSPTSTSSISAASSCASTRAARAASAACAQVGAAPARAPRDGARGPRALGRHAALGGGLFACCVSARCVHAPRRPGGR